jgi:hypothetical protein
MSAEQLNVESFHGLIEIVQNADDLSASEVRVVIRKAGKHERLQPTRAAVVELVARQVPGSASTAIGSSFAGS